MIVRESFRREFDLLDLRYREAYEEMDHYNARGRAASADIATSEYGQIIAPLIKASREQIASFPDPRSLWLDAVYDCAAQYDIYRHLAPLAGKTILQIGGAGMHAVKFLLAGAAEAWILSPMLGEIECAQALARMAGVEDRFNCAVGVAEELPFADGTFHGVYSGGCVHHMVTDVALPQIKRILAPGGRFGASDPWRTPLYGIGTRIFGRREDNVFCRPLTPERVRPLFLTFRGAEVVHHGAFTRHLLLAASKVGLPTSLETVFRINTTDDAIARLLPGCRTWGSSVALLAERTATA